MNICVTAIYSKNLYAKQRRRSLNLRVAILTHLLSQLIFLILPLRIFSKIHMAGNNSIWHEGIVRDVAAQTIEVVIHSHSACSGCHAKGACGMSDTQEKIIVAERPGFEIKAGERVIIYATTNNAIYSVVLAYVIPSVLIILAVFLLVRAGTSEVAAAIASLVILAVYFWMLYQFRKKIGKKIKFTVEKKDSHTVEPEKLG